MSLLERSFGNNGSASAELNDGEVRHRNACDAATTLGAGLIRSAAAQRIRLGLTGLAAIFLLVLVAAAGMRPSQSAATESQSEPLAVLGVAPGAGPAAVPDVPAPPARPSRT